MSAQERAAADLVHLASAPPQVVGLLASMPLFDWVGAQPWRILRDRTARAAADRLVRLGPERLLAVARAAASYSAELRGRLAGDPLAGRTAAEAVAALDELVAVRAAAHQAHVVHVVASAALRRAARSSP